MGRAVVALNILTAIAAYAASLVVIAAATFFAFMLLAGPHGGMLPDRFQPTVLIVGWVIVIVLPAWIAWAVWRRLRGR